MIPEYCAIVYMYLFLQWKDKLSKYPGEMVDILHSHLLIVYWRLLSFVHVLCLLLCDDRASCKTACGWWVILYKYVLITKIIDLILWRIKSGYWQNHVNYILARNKSLLLCEEPPTTKIIFDVKYVISPLNCSFVRLIFYVDFMVYTLKRATCMLKKQCRQ